jgi:putative DNA primase/helicase
MKWPKANIGIITGRISGLVALDVDPRNCGGDTLTALEKQHDPLPKTAESRTGGGGRHILFAYPGSKVNSTVGALGEGLDIKADGGYIVAPPSGHASGKRYEWKVLPGVDNSSLAPPPEWLLAQIRQSSAPALSADTTSGNKLREGERNSTLASLGGSMRRRGMSYEAIHSALLTENAARCEPPLPDEEIEPIARSVSRYAPAAQGKIEHLTDLGNARRFAAMHGDDVRYCLAWGKWLVWDGKRWATDETQEILRRAKATVAALYDEPASVEDPDKRKALAQHATRSESENRITAMINLARSEPGIPVTPDRLDTDPWLLNVQNGTLDLRTGELRPPQREDLITKLAPVLYDPEARRTTWEAFLKEIMAGDTELIRYLQKATGYTLTGSTREQCLFILYGTGANGKSTLLRTLGSLLGDYARQTPTETLLAKRSTSIPNDIARLQGARFVTAIEAEGGRRLAEALVKQLTGGDKIAARFLHREFFEFEPTFKLFMAVNHKPPIQGTDHAIWRRIQLIPFDVTIPETEQDKDLQEKLREELPAILRWAVEGCLSWKREGLRPPNTVISATATYQQEMDVIATFIADRCVAGPGEKENTGVLYEAYSIWCNETGERPLSKRDFGLRLREKGFEPRGGRKRSWRGISVQK